MTTHVIRKLETIQRRIDHLEDRIDKSPIPLSYDLAEVSALRWIVNEYKRLTKRTSIYDCQANTN